MPELITKRITWPNTAEASARMRGYKAINLERALRNPNENWMAAKLATTGLKWTRQAMWGFRLFDFWCAARGLAVEVDGATHDKGWDAFRDRQDYERSGILVLRVRNLNEEDAGRALAEIAAAGSWNSRRQVLGLRSLGVGHADRYELPPRVKAPPAPRPAPAPPKPKPPKPRQARCSSCGTRVRTRRPDGAVRCRCKATTG